GDFERAFLPGRTAVGTPRDFGPLRLSLHRNGRHRPTLFSAVDAFASASVYLEGGNGVRLPCPSDGQAFRCPGGETRVAPEWHELKARPRRCLWFAPPGGNRRLVAEFPQVPAGARLVLEGGLIWDRGWHHGSQLTPTRFGVEDVRTGRSLLRVDVPVGVEGIQRAEVAPEGGGPLAVRIWSQADRAELRELCLELLSQGPEGAP
ncbi:MAG TPA: hypothetical protein VK420_18145, partial [Longimicrobium sp.]|nr:hypothetical protein [Longimicrobium sp.]